MGVLNRAAQWLGLTRSEKDMPEGVMPPSRTALDITERGALSLSAFYRAVAIHDYATKQISFSVVKDDAPVKDIPAWFYAPSSSSTLTVLAEESVTSLALTGNAYWRIIRDAVGRIISVRILNPHRVYPRETPSGRIVYSYKGKDFPEEEIRHLRLLRIPGELFGLGPIQAARAELAGAVAVRNYAVEFFDTSGVPSGVLSTEQQLTSEGAAAYKKQWHQTDDGGIRVIGAGLKFNPVLLSPKDAQWLEARAFSAVEIARLTGVPAGMLHAAIEGASRTYANIESEWIEFIRFELAGYISEIENALTGLLARGKTARANYDALLRPDTMTRYGAHEIAIRSGFLTINEVRAMERREPLPVKPAPAKEITP